MNGKRKFLMASVLSIQDSSFTYPACQNCFSRLSLSSNRYDCLKCGGSSNNATYRYKLCVKVAEGNKIYIITTFGSCLDKFFGISADYLQRHIHDSTQAPTNLLSERHQDVLFQAVEYFFIGQSFLFAVKIPVQNIEEHSTCGVSLYGSSRHMVACQISLPNDDPIGCSVFHYYNRLLQAHPNSTEFNDKNCSTTSDSYTVEAGNLCVSDCSYDSHPSGNNHFWDSWHQSFGLTSSSTVNSPKESSAREFSKDQCKQAACCSLETVSHSNSISPHRLDILYRNSSQEKSQDTLATAAMGNVIMEATSTCLLVSQPLHDTNDCCPLQRTPSLQESRSKLRRRQEIYLHKPSSLLSGMSQFNSLCSPDLPSKNARTAGTHHDDVEIWEDFLFSESLSEFIRKVENTEDHKSQLCCKTSKHFASAGTESSDTRPSRTSLQQIGTPVDIIPRCTTLSMQSSESHATARQPADGSFYNEAIKWKSRSSFKLAKRVKRFSSVSFSKWHLPPYKEKIICTSEQRSIPAHTLGSPSFRVNSRSRTTQNFTINPANILCVQKDNTSVFIYNQDNDKHMIYCLSQNFSNRLENQSLIVQKCKTFCFGNRGEHIEEKRQSDSFIKLLNEPDSLEHALICSQSGNNESYNGSADLFDTEDTMQEAIPELSTLTNGVHTKGRVSEQTDKPKLSLIPLMENSPTYAPFVAEDFSQFHNFIPYLQSTPISKQIRRSSCLGFSRPVINKSSNGKAAILFPIHRKSSSSLRNCIVKKEAFSRLEKSPNVFHTTITDITITKSPVLGDCEIYADECIPRLVTSPALTKSNRQRLKNKELLGAMATCKTTGNKCTLQNKENHQTDDGNVSCNEIKSKDWNVDQYLRTLNSDGVKPNRMSSLSMSSVDHTLNLSPITCPPLASQDQLSPLGDRSNLPGDWSPELFSEVSATSQRSTSLQRRLF